jgi:choloylglycine hydrolase
MCTSLLYSDASGKPYFGRTLELDVEEPWVIVYVPVGVPFSSSVDNDPPVNYEAKHAFIGVTAPARMPTKDNPLTANDLKVAEGLNTEGLSFSVLAYPSTGGVQESIDTTLAALQASDLGSWVLSQFSTTEQVKAALKEQPIYLTKVEVVGNATFPFHIVVHDKTGASLVIEWFQGEENVYDNPVGVMTNGPEFSWHMTNLNNYTFLSNKDQSKLEIRGREFQQPDSGIATVALPASNTSVGRFVRAVYYSNFAEKATTPDRAVATLAHVMNNFDRPRGITIDERFEGAIENVASPGITGEPLYISEYTSWTALHDLRRLRLHVRSYGDVNYIVFDLAELMKGSQKKTVKLSDIPVGVTNASEVLSKAAGI